MARFILIMFFMIEQRWRYIIEKELEPDGITTKQWLMLIIIGAGFRHAPSIQEVADAMSTTHQNVKQIAASMERRGFMTLERDEKNKRIIRLKVTDQCHDLFKRREDNDIKAMLNLFENLTDEEMRSLFEIIARLEKRAEYLYEEARTTRLSQANENSGMEYKE
ncbi:MarR family transcriptional regulator [Methanocella sp. CWC-04]|uniref:MarR family transcriptional regulator n=2 Tax=Methanooceanicella nereidis TaxID=2052831 RepID=A0AAP2RE10_9EURY|nr:MarR family transcriptional regulator [Methanocella sp. CWC-04]